ncbi:hypothetical protein JOB18_048400 [Solea senegalensis]|nr:hypothetical protein JOB18_048400 [Solea senegalensis]
MKVGVLHKQEPRTSLPAHADSTPIGPAGGARFDKRMSGGVADRDQERRHELMADRARALETAAKQCAQQST